MFYLVQPWGRDRYRQATVQSIHDTVEDAYARLDAIAEKLQRDGAPPDYLELYVVDEQRQPVVWPGVCSDPNADRAPVTEPVRFSPPRGTDLSTLSDVIVSSLQPKDAGRAHNAALSGVRGRRSPAVPRTVVRVATRMDRPSAAVAMPQMHSPLLGGPGVRSGSARS